MMMPPSDRIAVPVPEEDHQHRRDDQLGRLLDQPDPEHRQRPQPPHGVVLEQSGDHHAHYPAEQQAPAQGRPVDQPPPGPPRRERHEGQRHHQRAEQDHRREEVRIVGVGKHCQHGEVQRRPHQQSPQPGPLTHCAHAHVLMVPVLAWLRHVAGTAVMDRADHRDEIANSNGTELRPACELLNSERGDCPCPHHGSLRPPLPRADPRRGHGGPGRCRVTTPARDCPPDHQLRHADHR